jgi:hypothetical protein
LLWLLNFLTSASSDVGAVGGETGALAAAASLDLLLYKKQCNEEGTESFPVPFPS